MIPRCELCLIVVVYNCSIANSKTLQTLFSLKDVMASERWQVVIWNNGPVPMLDAEKQLKAFDLPSSVGVRYREDISNVPLSLVYNSIISDEPAGKYCIFDHDTHVTIEYLRYVCSTAFDLLVPRINAQGTVHGPVVDGTVVVKDQVINLRAHKWFFAIGSGMCLSSHLIGVMQGLFGSVFDGRYALYGVDTSFCIRVVSAANQCDLEVRCAGVLEHSLSRLETESETVSLFRLRERALDLGITVRHYFSLRWVKAYIRFFVKSISSNFFMKNYWFLYGFIKGSHPRSH